MQNKAGVFIIGAFGHLAATVIFGALALKKGLCSETGMVTGLDEFSKLELIGPENLVFGGWDIREGSLFENVKNLLWEIHFPENDALALISDELKTISADIFPGTAKNCGSAI